MADPQAELAAISVCRPVWLDTILQSYKDDRTVQQRLARLALDPLADEGFSLQEGVLRLQGRIWIGQAPEIQEALVRALHDSATGGH